MSLKLIVAQPELALLDVREVGERDVFNHLFPLHLRGGALPPLLHDRQLVYPVVKRLRQVALEIFSREAHVDHEDSVPHDVAPPSVEGEAVHLDLVVPEVEGVGAGEGEGSVQLGGQAAAGRARPRHPVPVGRVVVGRRGERVRVRVLAGAVSAGQVVWSAESESVRYISSFETIASSDYTLKHLTPPCHPL